MDKASLIEFINAGFEQPERYIAAVNEFERLYGEGRELTLFSVPGRSEISGNHTDHNHGRVIAAALNLDIIAVASPSENTVVRIKSAGFPEDIVDIASYNQPDPARFGKSDSIIAGMAAALSADGYKTGGFDAYTTSDVLKGSGMSSSAAFEVMVGTIFNYFYNNGGISPVEIAKKSQYAENKFFGKPCGLMDQMACAVGGFITIDFRDPAAPVIEKLPFDLTAAGYALCITDTGGNHADLTSDYAAIPAEMKAVAAEFGKTVLRELTADDVLAKLPELRVKFGDRAVLRALHFFAENDRVSAQAQALRDGDLNGFFAGVTASGNSSFKYLQNVWTVKAVEEQGVSLALCLSERLLAECGKTAPCRVHGGGFAGTVQAFVPAEFVGTYKSEMDKVFGDGACHVLTVRTFGAAKLA